MSEIQAARAEAKRLKINSFGKSLKDLQKEIARVKGNLPSEDEESSATNPARKKPVAVTQSKESVSDARKRAEEIRAKRKERGVKIGDLRLKLSLTDTDPNYQYRWVNEENIEQREMQGYERIENEEARIVNKGSGQKAIAMRIPKEIYEEDQKEKQRPLDEIDKAIKSGSTDILGKSNGIEDGRSYGNVSMTNS